MPSNVRATGGATEVVIPRIPMPAESADSKSAVVTSPSARPIKAIPLERIVFPFTIEKNHYPTFVEDEEYTEYIAVYQLHRRTFTYVFLIVPSLPL